jgi:5'-nucleotidase/UDP-sugar diphosphatase
VVDYSTHPVLIVQSWEWAKVVGTLDVEFNAEGYITSYKGRPMLLVADSFLNDNKEEYDASMLSTVKSNLEKFEYADIFPAKAEAVSALDKYRKEVEDLKNKKVAVIAEELPHVRIPGSVHNVLGTAMPEGSHIAPVVADAMLWKAREVGQKADVAIVNAGGVRVDYPKGDLTVAMAYELLPFGNTLYVIEMSGEEVKSAIEDGINQALTSGSGAYPYVAGMKYTATKSGELGTRVQTVEIVKEDGSTESLDMNKSYGVVVQSFIAGGGDNYKTLAKASGYRYDTGFVDASVFMDYVASIGTVQPGDTSRVLLNE